MEYKSKETGDLKPYLLRVMSPGSDQDVLDDIYSDTAIGAISVGDLLDLPQNSHPAAPPLLRVVGIEHRICLRYRGGLAHFTRLFTEEVPDTRETRLGSRRLDSLVS
jgi:hypothetical protein